MDDFVLSVRQILQYPQQSAVQGSDALLLQRGGLGGPYISAAIKDALATALNLGGWINFAPGIGGVAWNGARLTWEGGEFIFNTPVVAPSFAAESMFINGEPVATEAFVLVHRVTSFNFRTGAVQLELNDIMRAGGAPILNPHLLGWCTATSPLDPHLDDDTIATCKWVQEQWRDALEDTAACGGVVLTFDGRGGHVWLSADDITFACTQAGAQPRSNTPPSGDASNRIATTMFVDDGLAVLTDYVTQALNGLPTNAELALFAPIDSPQFTGIPTAATAAAATSSGQLATTAFVHNVVTAATSGVASFNTRTGAVVLIGSDITSAGGALLVSPAFTGTPTAPTQGPGDASTRIATTAFVAAAIAAVTSGGVTSFNTRSGAVTLTALDVTNSGAHNNTALTGTPTAPTATAGTSTTQLATTAFVQGAVVGAVGVVTWNGRNGAVTMNASDISAAGGAPIASPVFTGVPAGPTATAGTNTTQLATTAFVVAAIAGGANVTAFNGRTGAVTLIAGDVTGVGGALLASPSFTGTPTAPTPAPGNNTSQLATTAFVTAALSASGVVSFNTRTGAVTLLLADVTGVGGAPIASPTFTGVPAAPTAAANTNTTQLATTAFVLAQITAGAVASFNGRTGAVTLQASDVSAVGGALLASPTFTGTPAAPTASPAPRRRSSPLPRSWPPPWPAAPAWSASTRAPER